MKEPNSGKNVPKPIHEQPFGDILSSLDGFFQNTVEKISIPRSIPVYEYETKKEYIIEAELPGIKKSQLSLDVYHNYIKISVNSRADTETRNDRTGFRSRSRQFQHAERTITLPFYVNEKEVRATLKDGLLTIRIPNRRKRIPVE
ncbi:Hsp20/alpha crystallin family protein [Alteribacter natronophilus]|uniref:Hsp20/alpha crystallin family protein n=1 Tax=Alteribacter natronophilus TaxID=2583810 RepID=UPI0014866D80|nr:Hsp20/alpha crystallin family protein [Alteribacter natronophilus]